MGSSFSDARKSAGAVDGAKKTAAKLPFYAHETIQARVFDLRL
jgi:hypothetical protein